MHTRFDTESRIAVAQAADIARELGHREVGPGHLLLGLLANPRGTAYAALCDHGVNLDTARDLVADAPRRPRAASPTTTPTTTRQTRRLRRGPRGPPGHRHRPRPRPRGRPRQPRRRPRRRLGRPARAADRQGRGRRGGRAPPRHTTSTTTTAADAAGAAPAAGATACASRASSARVLRDVRRSVQRDRLETDDRDEARRVPGMTGAPAARRAHPVRRPGRTGRARHGRPSRRAEGSGRAGRRRRPPLTDAQHREVSDESGQLPRLPRHRTGVKHARLLTTAALAALALIAPVTASPAVAGAAVLGPNKVTMGDRVPWGKVGHGWYLTSVNQGQHGEFGINADHQLLDLVDPLGGRYQLAKTAVGKDSGYRSLEDWSADGRTALELVATRSAPGRAVRPPGGDPSLDLAGEARQWRGARSRRLDLRDLVRRERGAAARPSCRRRHHSGATSAHRRRA